MKTDLIKVLYITHYPGLYGANKSLLNLISGLPDNCHVSVIVPVDGDFVRELKQIGVKTNIIRFKNIFYQKNDSVLSPVITLLKRIYAFYVNFFALQQIAEYVRKNEIDIIHSNSSVFNIGYRAFRKTHIKHVWHLREFADLDYNLHLFFSDRRYRNQLYNSNAVITVSHALKNHYRLGENAGVIYNGVMKKKDAFVDMDKSDYFLFCGTVTKQKGIEDAIYAFSEIQKKHKDVQLIVAGSINAHYKSELDFLCKKLSVSNIRFLGYQKDIRSLMLKAKALLMCSYHEAMGRVTVEAMMLGCPVIGYNNAGTGEIIKHNDTGFLYENMGEFVHIMENILTNYSICYPIINNAFQCGKEHFTQEQYVSNILKIYYRLLNIDQ